MQAGARAAQHHPRRALEQSPDLRKLYDENPETKRWLDTARKLEGLARHAGVHAAGVVIGSRPLDDIVPLATSKQGDKEVLITQWDGPTCEKVGLLKMDFLGLRTLSIIERAKKLVRETLDETTIRQTIDPEGTQPADWDPLDLDRLSYDDPKVLSLFRRGDTVSVFQFESDGMRRLLRSMAPDRLEDLIAANALYRPGPMALIEDYNARKHGRQPVPQAHSIVEKFTAETYGIMVYQEQVMQIVHELGGIPLRAAYSLIKAISKKKHDTIAAQKAQFLEGAGKKGVSKKDASQLFDLILKFAGYGFNKSHSTGYAIVAYQTAYLKTYFPVQYMAAVLTFEAVSTEKVVKYIDECQRVVFPDGHVGVAIRAPDVNTSGVGFTPVFSEGEPHDANHGHVRFGLSAVKGVGEKAVLAILEQREKDGPFTSLYDFCERVSLGAVNRATIEALIKCGAFDRIHGAEKRAALLDALDGAMQAGQRVAADRASGQTNLFGMLMESAGPTPKTETKLPEVPPWSPAEQLKEEKSVLGFYVSSHPLDQHGGMLERFVSTSVAALAELPADTEVTVGGLVTQVRRRVTQRGRSAGQTMAILGFEDKTGSVEAVVFSEIFSRCSTHLEEDRVVFLKAKLQKRDDTPSLVVNKVIPIEQALELAGELHIVVREPEGNGTGAQELRQRLMKVRDLLWESAGGALGIKIDVLLQERRVTVGLNGMRVKADGGLPEKITQILGDPDACCLVGSARQLAA
ncbi:MAG: DNA polymerase III subunit alpha [Thermoanaerobaculia bacterium]|nr:DNA polymerase III subunit alpha [Thermoanaerobaculia bacterium]